MNRSHSNHSLTDKENLCLIDQDIDTLNMTLVPSTKDFRDKMPNTTEKRNYNKYKRRQQSRTSDEHQCLLSPHQQSNDSPMKKSSVNESFRQNYARVPTSDLNMTQDFVLKPITEDLVNKRMKAIETTDKLYQHARIRDRKINDARIVQEEHERRKNSFAPSLQNSNSKKRSLHQIIEDLYPKKQENSTERYAGLYQDKVRTPGSTSSKVFSRLYNTGREKLQKREEKVQEIKEQQIKVMFSPKVNPKSKQMTRKHQLISPKAVSTMESSIPQTFRINLDETKQNVFDYLNEDAIRRKREQEILEARLNNPKSPQQVISQNSVKVLYKKLSNDISKALLSLSSVYGIGTDNTYELNEEQFVALLYTLGLFKDIGSAEESLYEDLLRALCMKGKLTPVFTVRNVKVLIMAIYDIYQEWMSEQDKSEWEGFYHRRIQKYKLMRTKFQAPNSDALRFSCLETPINMDPSEFLTDEEKCLYLEQDSWSGLGVFKGKSLCLNETDVNNIHKKFHQLYANRLKKEQELKHSRHHSMTNDATFAPKICEKSKLIVTKMEEESRRLGPVQRNEIICRSKPRETIVQYSEQIEESVQEPQQQIQKKPINYQRLNHLYQKGKQKVLKGIINELETPGKLEEQLLSECTFKPLLHTRTKSREKLNQTLQEDMRRKKVGTHKKTYSEMAMLKKIMNKTQTLDQSPETLTSEPDEMLIVEVQLGENIKKQIQLNKNDQISDVAERFCYEHGLGEDLQQKVEGILANILSTYYKEQ